MHTTNYFDTLIAPPDDCRKVAQIPKTGTIADLQFSLLGEPYRMTSDSLLVAVAGTRRGVPRDEWSALYAEIFAKGQPCLRASPLVKTSGWAVHFDANGRVALVDPTSDRFRALALDPQVTQLKGMRNKRS